MLVAALLIIGVSSTSAASPPAPAPPASKLGWTTTILDGAVSDGAVCLDGSAPGYHIQSKDPERWTIHLQGGGWCTSVQDCFGRSNGALGSSKSFKTDMDSILAPTGFWHAGGAHGIFSSDPAVNPDFHNHTKVYARYCDGASFAGNLDAPVTAPGKGRSIHFRGRRVLDAVLDSLIAAGLGKAKLFIVNGCSAGGLAVYLHLDYIASRLPGVRVVGVPECGLFMDESHWNGKPGFTPTSKNVAQMQNVSGGVNAGCMTSSAKGEEWKCFMAQYTLPHIQTPHYIVNSFYDAWQWGAVLGMPNTCHGAGCAGKMPADCPAGAHNALEQLRANMISNQSHGSNPLSSAFLYACNTHCGQFSHDDRWGTLEVKGKSLRSSFTHWLTGATGTPATVDCDGLGCNPTCCDSNSEAGSTLLLETGSDLIWPPEHPEWPEWQTVAGNTTCFQGTSCAAHYSSNGRGCCPYEGAVCCPNGQTCCPGGTTCSDNGTYLTTCMKGTTKISQGLSVWYVSRMLLLI